MNALRDYEKWLDNYTSPESPLSWRLRQAQTWIDRESGPAIGALRYAGPPVPVLGDQRLFTFGR